MRPGQLDVNGFERALLEHMARDWPSLSPLIPHLHVLSREFTGVGSYTNFAPADGSNDLGNERIGLEGLIAMPGVPNGMGAVLFCDGGVPKVLETYTFGLDHWDGVYTGFTISSAA